MREEFEAWYEGHCAPLESDWFKRDNDFPDDYDYFPAQEAWAGWQASRAALCGHDSNKGVGEMIMKNADAPAILLPLGDETAAGHDGLTKREMMAMHMMAAMLTKSGHSLNEGYVARDAVRAADALLAELGRTK